jgi:hypothetical protein
MCISVRELWYLLGPLPRLPLSFHVRTHCTLISKGANQAAIPPSPTIFFSDLRTDGSVRKATQRVVEYPVVLSERALITSSTYYFCKVII